SKFTVLPLSKFGLMQITRQRVRPEVDIKTREVCPTCDGTGKITASILVTDQVEKDLEHLLMKQNEKKLTISLHPYLFAFFTKGFISRQWKWFFKYKRWITLVEDSSVPITQYNFLNGLGEEIEL
ncbi:MAG: ribonuclease E/G, partial [Reichenbachiella sp.]